MFQLISAQTSTKLSQDMMEMETVIVHAVLRIKIATTAIVGPKLIMVMGIFATIRR